MPEMTPDTSALQAASADAPQPASPISMRVLIGTFLASMLVTGGLIFVVLSTWLNNQEGLQVQDIVNAEMSEEGVRVIDPPRAVADFALPSQTGNMLSLSVLRGKPVLLYFGYTHCPDVCLLSLNDMKKVHEGLAEAGDDVHFLFISVDGQRDTPQRLAQHFNQRAADDFMLGMSGDPVTLAQITPDYNLYYKLNDDADQNGNYSVDHTSNMFLLDAEGRLVRIFAYGTLPSVILEHVRALL